jgi:hypothetical protein
LGQIQENKFHWFGSRILCSCPTRFVFVRREEEISIFLFFEIVTDFEKCVMYG